VSANLDLVRSIDAALNDAYRSGTDDAADVAAFAHPDVVLRASTGSLLGTRSPRV